MPSDNASDAKVSLVVARAEQAAVGVRLFELKSLNGGALPTFTPGAHISVCTPNGMVRKYSLTNNPDEGDRYEIAVKRDNSGRGGSVDLIDNVKVGDTLLVSMPRNDFELKISAAGYTFIAGGIGITPILSMVRYLKASGVGKFKLYYLSRSVAETAFIEELSTPAMRGAVTIHHTDGQSERSFDLWSVLEKPRGHLYCCGPRRLMSAVRDMTGHWSTGAVHFEAFSETIEVKPEDRPFVVNVKDGIRDIEVPVGTTMLDALRSAGLHIASSCESGTCGSCKTKLVSGDVEHRDLVLSEAERRRNIMPCVSRARGGALEIEL